MSPSKLAINIGQIICGCVVCLLGGAAAAEPSHHPRIELAQIIIGPGVINLNQRFFLPNSALLPPLAAFQAEISDAGPATSSGLLFYQTPGLTWSCQGTMCGAQGGYGLFTLETCVELVRQVGPILALSAAGQHAISSDIDVCNAIAADESVPQPGGISPPGGIAPPNRIAPPG